MNEFIAIAGGAELWQPGSIPYESWIKEMSSKLIQSGAVDDEIFSQMAPVCNLNVSIVTNFVGELQASQLAIKRKDGL